MASELRWQSPRAQFASPDPSDAGRAASRWRATSVESLLARVDPELQERVAVAGALPPEGRDVDLLARTEEFAALAACLTDLGFRNRHGRWVRFDDDRATIVELLEAEALALPPRELAALFADAAPFDGLRQLVEPSPAHRLLLLARKRARSAGGLRERDRAKIDRILAADRSAWTTAERRSAGWRAHASLACLRAAYTGSPVSRRMQAAALLEALAQRGEGSVVTGARRVALPRLRRGRGGVVALSGLDGAGKSTQASALAQALGPLGYRPRVVWAPIGNNGPVEALGTAGKRLLAGRKAAAGDSHTSGVPAGPGGILAAGWVTLIGVANAAAQARTRLHVLTGRVAVCDRYVLDTAVHLLHRYGDTRAVRTQIRLVSLVAPKPARAYLVEVPPELALERKTDRWTREHLTRRAELYRGLHERFGAKRIDGARARATITAEIVREVWESL